MQTDWWRNYT